ncbi:MAG: ABC transporter permease, partial [SAR324 cluster bacterium]|nr:ABC transporter permease [SAR324 cluster bacterium]
DSGVMVTGYIGSFLMAGAYLAITSFTSSLTKNQVISFILSFMVCLILVMLGWGVLTRTLVEIFPVWLADLITQFSFTTHFNSLRRGIIDLRDVVYFASIIVIMLYANVLVLDNSRAK